MESAHLDLIVHAHWTEHQIEDVKQNDAHWDSFFLVCAAFAKQLNNAKAVEKSGCCIHGFLKVFGSVFCLYISGYCVIIFHRQCLSDV